MNEKINYNKLEEMPNKIRKSVLKMINNAGSGHPGGSLSVAEILSVLYFNHMNIDTQNPDWEDRDRFILSKGHASAALYAALSHKGYFAKEELMTFDFIDSRLQGHPDMKLTPGVDMSSGSLGQGLSPGVGMAIGAKLQGKDFNVYVLLGDGECQEGQVWEAAMCANKFNLDNLIGIIDYNKVQLVDEVNKVMPIEPLEDKWRSFGWHVINIDGHDIDEITESIQECQKIEEKPSMIIAHTVKGKGVSFMEDKYEWHSGAPNDEELDKALKELS